MSSSAEDTLIRSQLPADWSEEEIQHFLSKYTDRIAMDDVLFTGDIVEEEEVVDDPLPIEDAPIAALSRKGLMLDSHIILDGRSVTLRAVWEAGQLVPFEEYVTEGPVRAPYKAIRYGVRIVDRPRILYVTPETYKVLSDDYPHTVAHDEALTPEQLKRVQATVTVLKPDKLDPTIRRWRPFRKLAG